MPLYNHSRGRKVTIPVVGAYSYLGRLAGLFALSDKARTASVLHLRPCSSIHTFYLEHPIDVLFLDRKGVLLKAQSAVQPNRVATCAGRPHSVLEAKPGLLELERFTVGDHVVVEPDNLSRPSFASFRTLLHLPVNMFLAIFWLRFVLISFFTFVRNGSWFGLGLMVFNSLLVFFFLTRRQSKNTTSRWYDWIAAIATVLLSMSLKPDPSTDPLREVASVVLQASGLSIMLYSLLCLGKSFGIVPANRSVKSHGAYAVVRHPLYSGELIFYFGFLFGHFNWFNMIKILLIFLGQLWRVQAEESVLRTDKQYRDYCLRVPYRFLPKLF